MILVDTNVLVYAINVDAPQHHASYALIETVRNKQIKAMLVPQILLEFFAVITDHRRVEKPLDSVTAWHEIEKFLAIFQISDPGALALEHLGKLLGETSVRGSDIFDAWLVAQMQAYGISTICTYNTSDLSKFPVTAQTPEQVLGSTISPGTES